MKRVTQTVWNTDKGDDLLVLEQKDKRLKVIPASVDVVKAHELLAALQDAVTFMESNDVAERLHDHADQSAVLNGDN